jgi:CarD family transcriptional regulator
MQEKELDMQFQVGDYVVHPAYGVGQVDRIEERKFSGTERRLYYEVNIQNGTVWVPVETQNDSRLRPVTAKKDLARYRSLLKKIPSEMEPDHRKRHTELAERMKAGSFEVMCEIVRDLTARSWRQSLNEADLASLRKARESLCQEWSVAKGISLSDADHEIEALLLEARQMYKS